MAAPHTYQGVPAFWPVLPEAVASIRCDTCTWAYFGGVLRVKAIWRGCPAHGWYLDRGQGA
jgi:hypothetical protein